MWYRRQWIKSFEGGVWQLNPPRTGYAKYKISVLLKCEKSNTSCLQSFRWKNSCRIPHVWKIGLLAKISVCLVIIISENGPWIWSYGIFVIFDPLLKYMHQNFRVAQFLLVFKKKNIKEYVQDCGNSRSLVHK